jgi:hypothetical protein
VIIVILFDAYLRLSKTYAENSDEANILLMANDMLHGNVILAGWNVSDVPFITTELPEITLLVAIFGLHLNTAHIAAALTYTAVIAIAMLLAKGSARGPQAIMRMALVLAIMLAPQPGVGVFALVFSVGHIGTAAPVMLSWLILDRIWRKARDGAAPTLRQRWSVALIVGVLLGWALMADPLVLVVAIYPLLAVCLVRVVPGFITQMSNGSVLRAVGHTLDARWLELSLAAAAGIGYLLVWAGRALLAAAGGYNQQAVPFKLDGSRWLIQARVTAHGLLEMFGAYFVPGQATSGLEESLAITRLACAGVAVLGCCAIARRFFRRDADLIGQLLLAAIVLNLAAYVPSTLADHSALNVREIAPVLPFAAVLAARTLGDRLLALGPLIRVRLPRIGRPLKFRLILIPLVALFCWYGFGLFKQAASPAAANPFAGLERYLQAHGLSRGLGGYWEASVITVDTGGAVTIRAVTSSCLQPYQWEDMPQWYDPGGQTASFLLISNQPGYFSSFKPRGSALQWLISRYPDDKRYSLDYGNSSFVPGNLTRTYDYNVRVYRGNLLAQLPALRRAVC